MSDSPGLNVEFSGTDINWPGEAPHPQAAGVLPQARPDGNGVGELHALRTRGVDIARVRPTRWLWKRRVPLGLPSLLVGEKGVGKGTFVAWLIAQATLGKLEGDLHGQPTNVLLVGDEDAFESIWVPRIWAAGGDLARLRTLDDGEYIDNFATVEEPLAAAIERDHIGLLLLDALIDHIPGGEAGASIYNPKHVRETLRPIRRVSARTDVAALGLLHPIKGNVSSFRQLMAGSHQFNAVSRSSLLLTKDPADETLRVLVRSKGNHSAEPRSIEFAIAADAFELNGHGFEMPKVVNLVEGDRTVTDLLRAVPDAPVRDELAEQLSDLLTTEAKTLADLARAVGRDPKDGSVRNALNSLKRKKRADRTDAGWTKR